MCRQRRLAPHGDLGEKDKERKKKRNRREKIEEWTIYVNV
jgi:hypothetical protein